VPHVGHAGDGLAAGRFDVLDRIGHRAGQLGVRRFGLADHGDVGAVARCAERDGLTDAAAGARDK
jgi:hypothetical protein